MAPHRYNSAPVNRGKRFVLETAIAAPALGTFRGIFYALELKNLCQSMNEMRDNHNLFSSNSKNASTPNSLT